MYSALFKKILGKENRKRIKNDLSAIAVIVIFYIVLTVFKIGCPIKFLTGISCPGCGMTRAWISVLRLDLTGAFNYHPLFWIMIPVVVIWLIHPFCPKQVINICIIAITVLFIIVYVYRLLYDNTGVVEINLCEGFIYKSYLRLGGINYVL